LGLPLPSALETDLLVSFVGTVTHPVRQGLLHACHPRGWFEESTGFLFHDSSSADFQERRRHFAEVLLRSKFVLCPRGHGTASIRLYETLAAGRAPVIISDEWVAPEGPDWAAFSVRWPEKAPVAELFEHLERVEDDAVRMGALAREAYTTWFARDVAFDRLVSGLEQLIDRNPSNCRSANPWRQPGYARQAAAQGLGRLRSRARWRARA
jgi:hypothetical protein